MFPLFLLFAERRETDGRPAAGKAGRRDDRHEGGDGGCAKGAKMPPEKRKTAVGGLIPPSGFNVSKHPF